MSYVEHFERECELLGWNDKSQFKDEEGYEMQQYMKKNVLDVLNVISEQGHSGMSIHIFKSILDKAIMFKPLGPLTGKDNEWGLLEYCDDVKYQNLRLSEVFKDADGKAYHSSYYVFTDDGGGTWTNGCSRKYIDFPYTPPKEKPVITIKGDLCEVDDEVLIAAIKEYEENK